MGFDTFGKKIAQIGQDTKSSVQKVGNVISINSKITEETDKLNELLAKVGEAAYTKFADNPPEGLEETFAEIKEVKENLDSLKGQREKAKGVVTCPECGKEYPVGENFCSACGAKLPEVEIVVDEEEETAEAASEVAEKAKGIFNSFAGKADAFVKGFSSGIKADVEAEAESSDEGEEGAGSDVEEEFFGEEETAGEDTASDTDKAAEFGKKAGMAASRLGSEAQKMASKVAEKVTEAINNAKEQAPETDEVEEDDDFLEVEVPAAEEAQEAEEPAAEEPAAEASDDEPKAEE